MPLSFPSNPSLNQLSTQNGRVYRYAGNNVWELAVSGGGASWVAAPASATATGTAGQIAYDADFFYVATATNTWKRAALTTWVPFTPASVTGLQLWLDASDASTLYDATSGGSLVAADGAVARWEDKSGNGRHATQATSGSRPLRKTAVQGGKDVLRFDGSDDFFSIPSSTAAFTFLHSAQATVFVVVKVTDQADGHECSVIDSNGGSTMNIGYNLTWQATNDAVYAFVTAGGTRSAWGTHNNAFTPGGFSLTSFITDITNSTAASRTVARKNGGAAITGDNIYTNGGTSSASSYNLSIGGAIAGGGKLPGDIAEICIYNAALSDTDRAAVESYLMNKWGIAPAPVPQTIPGLQLWLDASSADTLYDATSGGSLVAADGAVARWEDKSGNSRHFTQSTSGSRPLRKTSQQNGKDTLLFDGTNDFLDGSDFLDVNTGGLTAFVVFKRNATGSLHELLTKSDTNGKGWFLRHDGDNKWSSAIDSSSGTASRATSSVIDSAAYSVMTWVFSAGAFTSQSFWRNAASQSMASASGSVNTPDNTSGIVRVGVQEYLGTYYYHASANFAEILLYNAALSDTDRAAVESYLMTKWGIA